MESHIHADAHRLFVSILCASAVSFSLKLSSAHCPRSSSMRTADEFWNILKSHDVTFFAGVPCSLLEGVINAGLADPAVTYIPAVREDVALGIASAAHLTGHRGGIL